MRTRTAGLLPTALLAATAAMAGCAAEPPAATPTRPASTPTSSPAPTGVVRVQVSGGIQGTSETHEVRRQNPPQAMTAAEVDRLFTVADSEFLRGLDGQRLPRGDSACCDRRTFEVTVRHADGSRTQVTVVEGAPVPDRLSTIIRLVTRPA